MRYQIVIKINKEEKNIIKKGRISLPENTFDFIAKEDSKLIKVQTSIGVCSYYSILEERELILNENLLDYFSGLTLEDVLFGSIFIEKKDDEIDYEIYFSKDDEILNFNDDIRPQIPQSVIKYIEKIGISRIRKPKT